MKSVQQGNVRHEAFTIFLNGICFKNPVLIGALGIYPVAAAGYSLRNGAALSLMMLIMMVPVCMLSGLAGEAVPNWVRPAAVVTLTAALYLPAQLLVEVLMPGTISALGVCGMLMVANSIILSRANDYAPDHINLAVFADSFGCTIGFSVVVCLISALRELLSKGTLWGKTITSPNALQNVITAPFFAFILLGFLAALVQWLNTKRVKYLAKRRMTHQ